MTVKELYEKMSEIGMEGWISNEEGEYIAEMAEKLGPESNYMEIGVAFGKSLATVCKFAHPQAGIFGIDILNWEQRNNNMDKLGVKGRSNFIEGDSQWEALGWPKERKLDLLFIDGDHTYYGIVKDLLSWLPHVKKGGTIMLHDYAKTSPGVMKAVHDYIYPHSAYTDFEQHGSIYSFKKL